MKLMTALAFFVVVASGAAFAATTTSSGLSSTDTFAAKKCKYGYYWSKTQKKCVRIPAGSH